MCGIAGCLSRSRDPRDLNHVLDLMARALYHRGPDQQGIWASPGTYLGLAHRRLSILDLTDAGKQPMTSPSGRYVLVFNGEIYNHIDLRCQLSTHQTVWRGHSDTETLVVAFDQWGVAETLEKTIGMFAIAVWDQAQQKLLLARDRLGEKPLYYGWSKDLFIFGSEIKAIRAHPGVQLTLNRDSVALLMRHNYIPTPYSIFREIKKLEPGAIVEVGLDGQTSETRFWSIERAISNAIADPLIATAEEADAMLEKLLLDAVRRQMASDVPLGAFLSGGVDSSLVVALMQAQSPRRVKTFTIGFEEAIYDESIHAGKVAAHLGTDHSSLSISEREAQAAVPKMVAIYDEPFADSSQIPTLIVAALARKHVTVALSGDGGDELFGGYARYTYANSLWNTISMVPKRLRSIAGGLASTGIPVVAAASNALKLSNASRSLSRLEKGLDVLHSGSMEELYWSLVSHWRNPSELVLGGVEPSQHILSKVPTPVVGSGVSRMMCVDLASYLPDDILCKVDRAAMSVSLETRVPMLDHRVVEFAWRMPLQMKVVDSIGKAPLRRILYRHVPRALIDRPKMGFGVPIGSWLRNGLRDWSEELLSERCLRDVGILRVEKVRKKWEEHVSGKRNWQYHLWDVLSLQAWARENRQYIGNSS